MPYRSFGLIRPLLWEITKNTPEGRLNYILGDWERLVGLPLSAKTEPSELRGDTLVITVSSPIWEQALKKMTKELLNRIYECCDGPVVRHVEFQVGRILPRQSQSSINTKPNINFSLEERERVLEGFEIGIEDPELREITAAAAAKNLLLRSY